MKLEPSIILRLFIKFSNSKPEYFYNLYFYEKVCNVGNVLMGWDLNMENKLHSFFYKNT